MHPNLLKLSLFFSILLLTRKILGLHESYTVLEPFQKVIDILNLKTNLNKNKHGHILWKLNIFTGGRLLYVFTRMGLLRSLYFSSGYDYCGTIVWLEPECSTNTTLIRSEWNSIILIQVVNAIRRFPLWSNSWFTLVIKSIWFNCNLLWNSSKNKDKTVFLVEEHPW